MKPNLSHYEEGAATALLDSGESVRKVRNYLEAAWMDRHDTGHIPGAHVTRIKQAVRQLRDSMLDTSLIDPLIIHNVQITGDGGPVFEGIRVVMHEARMAPPCTVKVEGELIACPDCGEPFADTANGPWCGRPSCEGEAQRKDRTGQAVAAFNHAWERMREREMEMMRLLPRQFMARNANKDRLMKGLFPVCVCWLAPEECLFH